MPGPVIGTTGFDNPPDDIHRVSEQLYEYLAMLHNTLFAGRGEGLGILDEENIVGDLTNTVDHGSFTNIQPYQHRGSDAHAVLKQAAAVAQATVTSVNVATANAGAAYAATEQALLNEVKADLNTLATSVLSIGNQLNALLSALRTAGFM